MSDTKPLATVRASAWAGLFDCAKRFEYSTITGLRIPGNGRSTIGHAIHAGTAVFDQGRLSGIKVSALEAVETARDAVLRPTEEVIFDDEVTQRDAESFATILTAKYCQEIAPTREYSAVEVQCQALDIKTDHGVIRVTGTTDRVRKYADGTKGISDLKSGKTATTERDGRRIAVKGAHHIQLGVYTLMAEQGTGEALDGPAEIVGLSTTKAAPVGTVEIADVKTVLLGTDEEPGLIDMAGRMLKVGVFPPNPKSTLCSQKYCAGYSRCPYHA